MNETEVILKTHDFLRSTPLGLQGVTRLFTDAYSSLLPYSSLAPFQRFILDMGDFVLHPDLVGQLDDGETVFAVEAKGETDLLKGLIQAEVYQTGFHLAFLAADSAALGTRLVEFAMRKGIGVIAVGISVAITHLPQPHMPTRDAYQFIARQMDSVIQISAGQAFHYNIPTHYLVWAIAFEPGVTYSLTTLEGVLTGYPLPKEWRSALAGAQRLGLVQIEGNQVRLTPTGRAAKDILPATLSEWTEVHQAVGARGNGIPLVEYQPRSAAVLRLLLLHEPIVRVVVGGLSTFPNRSADFARLAEACDRLDHARAPIFFLKSEAIPILSDDRGRIRWELVQAEHYRSSTFYQYKSILKHAGLLTNTRLGGATTKGYDPKRDIWELA